MKPVVLWPWLLYMLLIGLITPQLFGMALGQEKMSKRSDVDVVKALGSRDHKEAAAAEKEVIRRGERMIPLLLRNKGDKRYYNGAGLGGKITSSAAFLVPKEGQILTEEDPMGLPVEVASLYLIFRIYYGAFNFADAPVLAYRANAGDEPRIINNSEEMINRVYQVCEAWAAKVKAEGLAALRKRKESPFDGTPFYWR